MTVVVVVMTRIHLGGLVLGQASSVLGAVQLQMKQQVSACFKVLKNQIGEQGCMVSDRCAGGKREVTAAGMRRVCPRIPAAHGCYGGGFRKDKEVLVIWGHLPGCKGRHRARKKVFVQSVTRT